MSLLVIVLVALFAVGLIAAFLFNKLVRLRNTVRSSWSDIDVHLKKRFNLIPGLVETVKAYAKHERETFQKVTDARSKAMQAATPAEAAKSENMIRDTLKSLFAVAEGYPELKASGNFLQFQNQFQEIEANIEAARRYYNAVVRDFNTLVESFPSNIVASMFNFKQEEFFQLDTPEEERKPVRPDFS